MRVLAYTAMTMAVITVLAVIMINDPVGKAVHDAAHAQEKMEIEQ